MAGIYFFVKEINLNRNIFVKGNHNERDFLVFTTDVAMPASIQDLRLYTSSHCNTETLYNFDFLQ